MLVTSGGREGEKEEGGKEGRRKSVRKGLKPKGTDHFHTSLYISPSFLP